MSARFAPIALLAAFVAGIALQAEAFEFDLPASARLTAERDSALDQFDAPIAVFDGVGVSALTVEGQVTRRAWRISVPGLTPLQVIVPLRPQLTDSGYTVLFECEAADCGGFDFRFQTEVLPGPNMYVNLSRYRYMTAVKGNANNPEEVIGILVSATAESAYLQIIRARPRTGDERPVLPPEEVREEVAEPVALPETPAEVLASLKDNGRMILSDLDFDVGTTDLGPGPFASLAELAALLEERSDLRIALVGHSDPTGGFEINLRLSRERARSVRDRLVTRYGIAASRLDAEGVAYLAPIAPNLTEEGRALNRRVEAVWLNTE